MTAQIIQPMPELDPEQLDALRADIAANGVLVPVIKDQHGRILDGNHRAAIAAELGIDYPTITVRVKDDADAWDKAVALNCARRHLTREQVRELIASEIRRRPEQSDRAIARRVGCSPSTVGAVRAHLRVEAEQLTEQIRAELDKFRGQVAVEAQLFHRKGNSWQTVGDVLEREMWAEASKLDSDGDIDAMWGPLWGRFFDVVRSYDCEPFCQVCTSADRQWREEHPQQVYRWSDPPEVTNLDTEVAPE